MAFRPDRGPPDPLVPEKSIYGGERGGNGRVAQALQVLDDMFAKGDVTGFAQVSRVGPELGRKLSFLPVAFASVFHSRKNPCDDADLIHFGKEKGTHFLSEG